MQEQKYTKYYDMVDSKDMSEKTPEEILAEEIAHKEFLATLGPKKIKDDSEDKDIVDRQQRIVSTHLEASAKPVPTSYLHEMHHEVDPKEDLKKRIGDLSCLRLSGAQVLVATYIRPERKKSGIILTSNVREEDKFQGKCGLVLKTGPLAYKATEKLDFGGYEAKIGDWVWYRPMDGYALSVNGVHCRVLDDVEIKGDIDNPDIIV